ncbi:hypothetical protein [Ruminococcus sp. 5_1_39BFAA]|uniref:hypothetical protein n=1 Tax=Ruminococcus sp. 5_1_39BFAA TaxID=457412 RepID=UPI0035661EA7
MGNEKENMKEKFSNAEIADISEACCEKIRDCEHEINKLGYWNIALVAYQMK